MFDLIYDADATRNAYVILRKFYRIIKTSLMLIKLHIWITFLSDFLFVQKFMNSLKCILKYNQWHVFDILLLLKWHSLDFNGLLKGKQSYHFKYSSNFRKDKDLSIGITVSVMYILHHICYNRYDKNSGSLQLFHDCGKYFTCSEKLKHKMETNTRLKFQSNSTKLIAVFLEVEYM